MSPPIAAPVETNEFSPLAEALRTEREKLKEARTEISLFSGDFLGTCAGFFYYRFEIPENLAFRSVDRISCTFSQLQPVTVEGRVVSIDNQFAVVALPIDFGPILPEIKCRWNFDEHLPHVIEAINAAQASHPVASILFHAERLENSHAVGFDPAVLHDTPADQLEALKKILQNRVSCLWGAAQSGKTQTLALASLSYLRAGKSVLLLAPGGEQADELLIRTIARSRDLGVDLGATATRVGMPTLRWWQLEDGNPELGSSSIEEEIETSRSKKKEQLEERVTLLRSYWKTKVHQYLHDDFYAKLNDLREQSNENKRQLDRVRDELAGLKETITRTQNASMLTKLKQGFSKESLTAAQKQLGEKQVALKRLQAVQQALTTELMRSEAQTPIESGELKEYQMAVKRIGELGGIRKVTEDVEQLSAVDEKALLWSKRCVATTVNNLFSDQRLRGRHFDLVLIDNAERVTLPYLVAASLLADEAIVLAGDPHQLGPESYGKGDLAQMWLQRDFFLTAAKTDELNQLSEWAHRNAQWCIPLTSHFTNTPKLSRFIASVLFDDKIRVVDRPGARGSIVFVDTSDLNSACRQYLGKKSLFPYNELQTKRVLELLKHVMVRGQRKAEDIGIVMPIAGTTLHTKLQLRLQGLRNVEVGTPQTFQGHHKKALIFDTTMAGVDYTMRQLDDRKIGEDRIIRMLNVVFSCVDEDLFVLADLSHFRSVYRDRLFTKLLLLLQAQSDPVPPVAASAKLFDDLDWDVRNRFVATIPRGATPLRNETRVAPEAAAQPRDPEADIRMKLLSKQQQQQSAGTKTVEQETNSAVHRVLGMRTDVNLLSQYVGGDLLFRHSLATEQAAERLPIDICQNEEEFRKIMERWNLLVYEMSGAGKTDLSFFAKHTPEARVRWDIYSLRAYYSSAMEAVMEESKHRIATSVSKVFQECLGKSQPANPAEWSRAYLNFLGKMEAYFSWISEQLRR